jgi:hypothetical protein
MLDMGPFWWVSLVIGWALAIALVLRFFHVATRRNTRAEVIVLHAARPRVSHLARRAQQLH